MVVPYKGNVIHSVEHGAFEHENEFGKRYLIDATGIHNDRVMASVTME